jgi:hypothetical protein
MKKRRWIGIAKFIFERQRGYLAIFNTIILVKMYLEGKTFQWWWLLAIPLFIIWTVFDMKVIYRQERSYSDEQSDMLKEILNDGKKR